MGRQLGMQRSREDWQATVGRSGLWTGFRVALSAIQAIKLGFKVYVATDACGDLNTKAQDTAVRHMIQTGARPMECSQVLAG